MLSDLWRKQTWMEPCLPAKLTDMESSASCASSSKDEMPRCMLSGQFQSFGIISLRSSRWNHCNLPPKQAQPPSPATVSFAQASAAPPVSFGAGTKVKEARMKCWRSSFNAQIAFSFKDTVVPQAMKRSHSLPFFSLGCCNNSRAELVSVQARAPTVTKRQPACTSLSLTCPCMTLSAPSKPISSSICSMPTQANLEVRPCAARKSGARKGRKARRAWVPQTSNPNNWSNSCLGAFFWVE